MPIYLSINKWGRTGNQLIQYMAALAIQRRQPGAQICDFEMPEFGILEGAPIPPCDTVVAIRSWRDLDTTDFQMLASQGNSHVVVDFHMQRMTALEDRSWYQQRLSPPAKEAPAFDDDYIVMHVRAEDVLGGDYSWYPLLPAGFYKGIAEASGRRPVLMGQLAPSRYRDELIAALPGALILDDLSPRVAFDTMRKAANLLPSVSTFAWLAAWLSEARSIHLPLSGWLNPAHMRDIDLLPEDDPRYRFYLFPMNFGVTEGERGAYHAKLGAAWRMISPAYLKKLRSGGPLINLTDIDYGVLESWYLKEYMDAADEISMGIYHDANHHFADIGRRRGYRPRPQTQRPPPPAEPLVSVGKSATQSSISPLWSRSKSQTADASGALNGDYEQEYGFHTDLEDSPWWMVDLGGLFEIREVRIYNRRGEPAIEGRLRSLVIEVSSDAAQWIYCSEAIAETSYQTRLGPICWRPGPPPIGRYLRLRLKERGFLHPVQVEVFGTECG